MKKIYSFIITGLLALTGCNKQTADSTFVKEISDLKYCEKDEIHAPNLYYSSSFNPIDIDEVYDLYFEADNSAEAAETLSEPIKLTADYKIDENFLQFNDCPENVVIKDNNRSLKINQQFSQMDTSTLEDGTVAIYFYPVVSEDNRIKEVQTDQKQYCDGIYEIRYVQQ